MTRYHYFMASIMLTVCSSCGTRSIVQYVEPERPNIILIIADDLGWSDTQPYGNQFVESPNLQRMSAEGIRLTDAYAAAPLCSPSRASIITGNNPARINLTEHLRGYPTPGPNQKLAPPHNVGGLPPETRTIAEALSEVGYISAHIGKWHLGSGASSPAASGFHFVYGGGSEGLPKSFFYPFFHGDAYPDLRQDSREGDFLDDKLTDKAIGYLRENARQPIFMQLNFYSPHVPIEAPDSLVAYYQRKRLRTGFQGLPNDVYAAMVHNIDYNVGRLLDYLRHSGLDKRTIVMFLSDNGGLTVEEVPAFARHTPPTTNAPLRGGKGSLYEGGYRIPWILWAPGRVRQPTVAHDIVSTDDIFNTCMELAGAKESSPDGRSMAPLLQGKTLAARDFLVHFPHYSPQRGMPGASIRRGPYKLIEWYEDGSTSLFHLPSDPGEANDISLQQPDTVASLLQALRAWRHSVDAQMPTPNPSYQPKPALASKSVNHVEIIRRTQP